MPVGCGEDEDPAHERDEARQRIQPDAERARQIRLPLPQQCDRAELANELHDDACGDERGDHRVEREAAADDRDQTNDEQ